MLALDLPVGLRLVTPPVGTDDGRLREKVIGVNVIKVRMGIDEQGLSRVVKNLKFLTSPQDLFE